MCHQGQEEDLAPPVQDHVGELDYDVLYSKAGAVSSVQCGWLCLSGKGMRCIQINATF